MSNNLFRKETVEFSRRKLGRAIDNPGIATWAITAFMVILGVCVVTFLASVKYAKKETVVGAVMPRTGVVRVTPVRAGTVTHIFVSAGQAVRKGDPLITISYDSILDDGRALASELNAATVEQIRASKRQAQMKSERTNRERTALRDERQSVEKSLRGLEEQREIQRRRIGLMEDTIVSTRALEKQKYVSTMLLRQREDTLLSAQQNFIQIQQSIDDLKLRGQQIDARLDDLDMAQAESRAAQELSGAQLEEKQLRELSGQGATLVSTRDGFVTSLAVKNGDAVSERQTLAFIVPPSSSTQFVHLWAPSRAIGFVKKGGRVRLMFDAYPYQTFGVGNGKIVDVAAAPVMPGETSVPIETKEQMYSILVALDRDELEAYGQTWRLAPGMRVSADIVLDERSLLSWLFDPIIATRKRAG